MIGWLRSSATRPPDRNNGPPQPLIDATRGGRQSLSSIIQYPYSMFRSHSLRSRGRMPIGIKTVPIIRRVVQSAFRVSTARASLWGRRDRRTDDG
eukprot:scaffold136823_cov57-Attheya_sp.AAC.1